MKIIPVVDLKGGQVVHARGGLRDDYRPVRSRLSNSSEPQAVVQGFLDLHPFAELYVADLDAIAGTGDNQAVLERLREAWPGLELWVDSGLAAAAACRDWLALDLGDLVIGSESQADAAILERLRRAGAWARIVLSLDFQGGRFLGPPAILERVEDWPDRVIVMTLARVGRGSGPDLDRIKEIRRRAPDRRIFAAGGVGSARDLAALAGVGASGVLIASTLHDGRIGRPEIQALVREAVEK